MYTICSCLGSLVSNVDPWSSLSQLNSWIEYFCWVPVFNVGSTCSSPCFGFSVFSTDFFATFSCFLGGSSSVKLLWTPNTSSWIRPFRFLSWNFSLWSLIPLLFCPLHHVSICPDFLACAFFSLNRPIVFTLTDTA